jgi:hypothetical protein
MPRTGVTKIHFDNLEFKIYHEEHKLYVIDHAYKKKYKLTPEQQRDLPFKIELEEYTE